MKSPARLVLPLVIAALSALTPQAASQGGAKGAGPAGAAIIDGTGIISGTVTAPRPIKAAQVHLFNQDKRVLYAVWTREGRFTAPNVFPGRYTVFSSGKLGKVDPRTGTVKEYDVPMPFSEPYDVWPDPEDRMWISDARQGGALIRFDPDTEKFTYYPTPRVTDQPKIEITREGAVWYCTRSSATAAVGVLYPDVSKMKYEAHY